MATNLDQKDEYTTFESTTGLVQKKPIPSSLKAKAVVLGFLLLAIGAFVGQKASQALAEPLELTDVAAEGLQEMPCYQVALDSCCDYKESRTTVNGVNVKSSPCVLTSRDGPENLDYCQPEKWVLDHLVGVDASATITPCPGVQAWDPANCPGVSPNPLTCWADAAYQECNPDRSQGDQGAYNAVMAKSPNQELMFAEYNSCGVQASLVPSDTMYNFGELTTVSQFEEFCTLHGFTYGKSHFNTPWGGAVLPSSGTGVNILESGSDTGWIQLTLPAGVTSVEVRYGASFPLSSTRGGQAAKTTVHGGTSISGFDEVEVLIDDIVVDFTDAEDRTVTVQMRSGGAARTLRLEEHFSGLTIYHIKTFYSATS